MRNGTDETLQVYARQVVVDRNIEDFQYFCG
jgi:hypothetical protein